MESLGFHTTVSITMSDLLSLFGLTVCKYRSYMDICNNVACIKQFPVLYCSFPDPDKKYRLRLILSVIFMVIINYYVILN
jgi:hypothetical protein